VEDKLELRKSGDGDMEEWRRSWSCDRAATVTT
jgi:hypothetical protein